MPAVRFLLILVFLQLPSISTAQPDSRAGQTSAADPYQPAYTTVLQSAVDEWGYVDYELLRAPLDREFRSVLKAIEEFDAASLETDSQKLAFWINAYNVQMLQNIIENGTIRNVIAEDRDQVFFRTPYRTAGVGITLDQIEHVVIRGAVDHDRLSRFSVTELDPRIHAVVNCAAVSCPRLRRVAFTEQNVDAELDAAMREFASSTRHFRMDGDVLVASSLLDWYGEDFDSTDLTAGDYVLGFMDAERSEFDAIRSRLEGRTASDLRNASDVRFEYDWTVNAARLR